MRLVRAVVVLGVAVGSAVWTAPVARAACHSFMVTATSPVTEGGTVSVTVSRDNGVADSHVDVSSVDVTAHAGSDYTAVSKTISFTGAATSQSFTVPTTEDTTNEPDETFKLHLSNPGGCAPNPNYVLGPDATVTIKDNDTAPTTAAPTTLKPTTTLRGATSTTPTTVGGAVTSAASTSTVDSNATTSTSLKKSSDSGSSAGLLIGAIVLVGAAAVAVALTLRRRR